MIPIDTLITFVIAATVLSLSPGPSNLYITARTLSGGHVAGICAALGMAIGSCLYVLATALGLSAVFTYSANLYLVVKLCGAAYLVYLGIQTLRSASNNANNIQQNVAEKTNKKVFYQSIIVELTNPKTALFFIAFLPQFVEPASGNVIMQLALLGLVYATIALSSDLFVVGISHQVGKWLSSRPNFTLWQDRIAGSVLLGLGGAIALEEIFNTYSLRE